MTATVIDPARPTTPATEPPLPYGPVLTRLLRPLQRAFLVLNGAVMAPLLRAGLGWLLGSPATGYLMLLRTRGRRTGLLREAPLGYVIDGGAVYCVAGYGRATPWYRNLVADPSVEVILPTRRFHGRAEPVTDREEWRRTYRALISSFCVVGRLVAGEVPRLDDDALATRHGALPVVRITPDPDQRPIVAGPFDPGGRGWLVPYLAQALLVGLALRGLRLVRRPG
ncbi:MAG TPA: nitroreductase/quinone reductase family protein [Candidatus Binatus sp.]|nr:nitroreductase/quinone reductase family protein [Candidatus Binatus sp.]